MTTTTATLIIILANTPGTVGKRTAILATPTAKLATKAATFATTIATLAPKTATLAKQQQH